MWPLEHTQHFSKIWSSFWPLRNQDSFSWLSVISMGQTFWPSFMLIGLKIWPIERIEGYLRFDLVFDTTWLIFKLIWYFILVNILTKFHVYWTENVAPTVYRRFFKIWICDQILDLTRPIFKLIWDSIEANILIEFHENRTYYYFFLDLTSWPSFWPNITHFQT